MKVFILTVRLFDNYGGLLQNYALQRVLLNLGHNPITIDYVNIKVPEKWKIFLSWVKTFFYIICGKPKSFFKLSSICRRPVFAECFVNKYIYKTKKCYNIDASFLKKNEITAVIVGSDQVWRPKYNCKIDDMFLKFVKGDSIKKIAYAASFGVDEWEYTQKQTTECRELAKKFNAISVREKSGVNLCKEYLDVEASLVLDPTLLIEKNDYCDICKEIPVATEKILVAYVLDCNDSVRELCESIAKEHHFILKFFSAGVNSDLTVPEWLAMFRDASYVVTDSFHGTVFSIIFEKGFKCIYNKERGAARFESLLNLYNSGKLEKMRKFSINWLKDALES